MTFLPIVQRELRAASRRGGTYWLRSGYGVVAFIICVFTFLAFIDSPERTGRHLFRALAWLAMPYCLLCGVKCTADCLSQEKREGTLGLLFLTDLKGYDIVLGKLVATSLSGFYGLVATFPILAVPLLLGGVTNSQFWWELCVLLNTFLFSLALGMAVSVLSRESHRAMGVTFAVLLLFAVVLPACAWLTQYYYPRNRTWIPEALLLPCPVYALSLTTQAFLPAPKQSALFWSVVTVHGLSWLLLGLASGLVAASWQDKPVEGWRRAWLNWRRKRTFGTDRQRKWLRTALLRVNPFYWAAARARPRPYYWRLLAIIALVWVWGSFKLGADWYNEAVYFSTAVLLNCTFKSWVASEAGRYLGQQRKDGTLEFVLSTPLSVKEILHGQWLALRRQFLGPFVVVIAVQLIFLAASLQRESFSQNPINPIVWVASIIMLAADTVALCWTGMWGALTVKSPNAIPWVTMTRLLAAPWGLFVVVQIMANLLVEPNSVVYTWKFYVGLWLTLGIILDLAFGIGSWRVLHHKFRHLALQPFVPLSSQFALFVQRLKRSGLAQVEVVAEWLAARLSQRKPWRQFD